MRLVVTGAGGGLGRAFLEVVPSHHDVDPFTHSQLDIGDHDAVMRALGGLGADAILNFAAFTKVDACESRPGEAYRSNALGVQSLAVAARASGALLLHVSSDYVFDGDKGSAYDEADVPNPRSVYARSKLAGEGFATHITPESFVVRTSVVFGSGTDYLSTAIERLAEGEAAGGIVDRIGTPTYVRHLAERIMPLVLSERFGTYHLGGPEATTWFDVLTRARRIGDLKGEPFEQRADDLGLAAERPLNSALTSVYAQAVGVPPMPPLDQAIKELLDAR